MKMKTSLMADKAAIAIRKYCEEQKFNGHIFAVENFPHYAIAGIIDDQACIPALFEALIEAKNQLETILADSRRYGFSNERTNMTSAAILQAKNAIEKVRK